MPVVPAPPALHAAGRAGSRGGTCVGIADHQVKRDLDVSPPEANRHEGVACSQDGGEERSSSCDNSERENEKSFGLIHKLFGLEF